MRITLFLLIIFYGIGISAQNSVRISKKINWAGEKKTVAISETEKKEILNFEGAGYNEDQKDLPVFGDKIKLSGTGKLIVKFTKTTFAPVENPSLIEDKELIKEYIDINSTLGIERKDYFALVTFMPIRYNAAKGIYEKLVDFELEINVIPQTSAASLRAGNNYAANSVLASGILYKIGVRSDGIHKIDRNFLTDIGINTANVDPRNIRIYGNGGGMLPEENGIERIDDLKELSIYVEGEADGAFDAADYILFYAQGPDQWKPDTVSNNGKSVPTFKYNKHLYDTLSYYFITVDHGKGKRISTASSAGTPNNIVDIFDDRLAYEQEKYNLINSGRRWMGDVFNYNDGVKSFPFVFSNIVSDSAVHIKTAVAARSILAQPRFNITTTNLNHTPSVAKGGSTYDGLFAGIDEADHFITNVPSTINVNVQFLPPAIDPESKGWLDYIHVVAKRRLIFNGSQMGFRSLNSVGQGRISEFRIQNSSNAIVWDVTDIHNIKQLQLQNGSFTSATDALKEFVAFTGNNHLVPVKVKKIDNQNIHGTVGQPDMIIVAHPLFYSAASQLATHHIGKGLDVKVLTVEQIYNEFSSGAQDITAIRDLMKMLYERAANADEMPTYLLLYGDGSFDYKNIEFGIAANTNFVPTYQSYESMHNAISYTSDDYFGLLDDTEGSDISSKPQLLDIAVGRLTVSTPEQAMDVYNKIVNYSSKKSFGNWRNIVTFVGDDEDSNEHFKQANNIAGTIETNYPVYNIDKIYLDAYPQVSTPGGSRYPAVNTAINNRIYSGSLIVNYVGHGGENGWAHERILGFNDINSWTNEDKLPLFVTATCSFSRFDNPDKLTAGEMVLNKKSGGAIALVSTVRLVYSNANDQLNKAFFNNVFDAGPNGKMPTLGEVMNLTKNSITGGSNVNNRKFLLIGDPAMTLAYPTYNVITTKIENEPFSGIGDTIKALVKVTISGEVNDGAGNKLTSFNGVVYPTIYDKPSTITTLRNDVSSYQLPFQLQKNIVYKGKASVTNGEFSYTFIVPKDIAYNFGTGKISYYASTDATDAHGYNRITIGGSADSVADDNLGPKVDIFMNDEKFVFGGLTNPDPVMLVKLSDENGINTAGSAIGHDISGLLNDDSKNKINLNEFYEAELDSYQKGTIKYPLSGLTPGRHTINVKAWDVYNNPGEGYTEFVVAESADLALKHVLNYPNPFTTNTSFWFEHNKPGQMLNIQVQIFTVSGKLVKNIQQDMITEGFRVDNISWNGLDEYGDKIGKGVYVYKVKVRAEDGSEASKFEKLVVLQ